MSHPSTNAEARKPAKSRPPNWACSRGVSFAMTAKTSETKKAKSARIKTWLRIVPLLLLPPERDVPDVHHHEQVEQAGDDQERIAVLVGHGGHLAAAQSKRRGGEIRQ